MEGKGNEGERRGFGGGEYAKWCWEDGVAGGRHEDLGEWNVGRTVWRIGWDH